MILLLITRSFTSIKLSATNNVQQYQYHHHLKIVLTVRLLVKLVSTDLTNVQHAPVDCTYIKISVLSLVRLIITKIMIKWNVNQLLHLKYLFLLQFVQLFAASLWEFHIL